jgi:hypothetical protein
MRDLTDIIRDNRAAAAAGHQLQPGAVGVDPQSPDTTPSESEPPAPSMSVKEALLADFLETDKAVLADYAAQVAIQLQAAQYELYSLRKRTQGRVNMMLMAVVHRVDEGTIGGTIMHPYIEAADDPHLPKLGMILLKQFEEATAPATAERASPVWGEFNAGPEKEEPKVRTPESEKKLVLVKP